MTPDQPIRVMHVIHRIGLGGTEYGVIKLVNALDRDRFAPYVCAVRDSSPEARSQLKPDVQVHELHRREGLDWRLPFTLARLMRRERIEIVHSHNWGTYPYAVAGARLAGVPVLIHGLHGRETMSASLPWRRRIAERVLGNWTTHFTAVSRELVAQARSLYGVPENRVRYCPNGVDFTRFDAAAGRDDLRRNLELPASTPVVATVAGMRPIKDPETLVRAFALVRREFPNARLLLVGVDPKDRFKRRMASDWSGWEAHRASIIFTGVRTDIPEILAQVDVYVNSSLYEGMSNTILEAMTSRKPVVATAVGGNPDLVQEGRTGFLVPPRDPPALADRIVYLLRHAEEARMMGEAGRAFVASRHSFRHSVTNIAELYEALRPKRRGTAGRE